MQPTRGWSRAPAPEGAQALFTTSMSAARDRIAGGQLMCLQAPPSVCAPGGAPGPVPAPAPAPMGIVDSHLLAVQPVDFAALVTQARAVVNRCLVLPPPSVQAVMYCPNKARPPSHVDFRVLSATAVQGLAFLRQEEIAPRMHAVQKYATVSANAKKAAKALQSARRKEDDDDAASKEAVNKAERAYRDAAAKEAKMFERLENKSDAWGKLGTEAAGLLFAAAPELAAAPFVSGLLPVPGTLTLLAPGVVEGIPGTPHGRKLRAAVVSTMDGVSTLEEVMATMSAHHDANKQVKGLKKQTQPDPSSVATAHALQSLAKSKTQQVGTGAGVLKVLLRFDWGDLAELGLCSRHLRGGGGAGAGAGTSSLDTGAGIWDQHHCVLTWDLPRQAPGSGSGSGSKPAQKYIGVSVQQLWPSMFTDSGGAVCPAWLPPKMVSGCQRLAWAQARVQVAASGLTTIQSLALQEELVHVLGLWLPDAAPANSSTHADFGSDSDSNSDSDSASEADPDVVSLHDPEVDFDGALGHGTHTRTRTHQPRKPAVWFKARTIRLGAVPDWTTWPPVVRPPDVAAVDDVDPVLRANQTLETLQLYPAVKAPVPTDLLELSAKQTHGWAHYVATHGPVPLDDKLRNALADLLAGSPAQAKVDAGAEAAADADGEEEFDEEY